MALIEMTPSGLRGKADELERLVDEHKNEMKRLRTLILGLNTSWKGDAQDAFVAKFLSMSLTFQKFESSLRVYAETMREAAAQTEELDRNLSTRIRRC